MKKTICLLLFVLTQWGCKPDTGERVDEYSYYPLKLNVPLIYRVTQTSYTASRPEPVITSWQEKDEVSRITQTSDGFNLYTISRSVRNIPSDPWLKTREYTVTRYPDKLLVSIDNLTTVPLIFPVSPTAKWNINQYNVRDAEECRYESIGQPRTVGTLTFDRTIQVTGREFLDDPIVQYNHGYSRYALGVGLIFDEQTDYYYCQEDHCLGQQMIASGTSTIRELIDYSREN